MVWWYCAVVHLREKTGVNNEGSYWKTTRNKERPAQVRNVPIKVDYDRVLFENQANVGYHRRGFQQLFDQMFRLDRFSWDKIHSLKHHKIKASTARTCPLTSHAQKRYDATHRTRRLTSWWRGQENWWSEGIHEAKLTSRQDPKLGGGAKTLLKKFRPPGKMCWT